jgi:glycosyltransferase involved in cell wall biosynthesis
MPMPFDSQNIPIRRVALFSGNYNCVVDGANRALNQLVAFLEKKGIKVLVFAPTCPSPAFKPEGTLVSVPSFPIPGRSEYRVASGLTPNLKHMLKQFNPDIIHLSAPDILGNSALKWGRKNKIPVVASFHTRFDTYPRYYNMAWLEKYLIKYMKGFYGRCDQVYSPAECISNFLRDHNMSDNIRHWGRGIDTSLFNPSKRDMEWRREIGIKDEEKTILFVGRLVLEKGLDIYAQVIDQLETRGIPHKALIVGEGPERQAFQERLPNAIFTGFQNGENLARAYASADIFVNPSITEAFGNVTLEAMASGVPAICADASGARVIVKPNETGFLVEPKNIDAYVTKIIDFIDQPELHQKFCAASESNSQNMTWHSILSALFAQYEEVIEIHRSKQMPIYRTSTRTELV